MKRSLFVILVALFDLSVQAQMKIDSTGCVSISSPSAGSTCTIFSIGQNVYSNGAQACISGNYKKGLYVNNTGSINSYPQPRIGIHSFSDASATSVIAIQGDCVGHYSRGVGVKGTAGNGTTTNIGILGIHSSAYNGAAVCGFVPSMSISADMPEITGGKYAGYFHGRTQVIGQLNVAGTITNTVPSTDLTLTDLNELDEEGMWEALSNRLSRLSAMAYYETGNEAEQQELQERLHYGLVVDQLKEIFPELVYEDESGRIGINYIELIPILVQTINEQGARLQALENGTTPQKAKAASKSKVEDINFIVTTTGSNTTIAYSLPKGNKSASVCISDLTGKLVDNTLLDNPTKGQTTISTSNLQPGVYLFSLIADGKVCTTKRMLIAN